LLRDRARFYSAALLPLRARRRARAPFASPSIGKASFDRAGWIFELKYDGYRRASDLKSIIAVLGEIADLRGVEE
jgi:ATP-dependent DNA ligase